jgi:hypothetical protein
MDDPGASPYVTGDYAVRNTLGGTAGGGGNSPSGTIGTAQGFKVNVNGAGSVQFTNAMRTAVNTSNIFRQLDTKSFWLSAKSSGSRFNQTLIGFAEDGTEGNDWGYDAPKMNTLGDLSLYSYMDGQPLAIQGYGQFEETRIVPLGLNSGMQDVVTLALDSVENMDEESIILEDRHFGIFHDLRSSSYVFQASDMTYADRFFIHFSPQLITSVGQPDTEVQMNAFITNGMLHIFASGELSATIRLFDMSGKVVLQAPNMALGLSEVTMDVSSLARGVYTVACHNSNGVQLKKVFK